MTSQNEQRYCPKCGADWRSDPIPAEYIEQGFYAPTSTHYSRRIAVYDRELDRTVEWLCPDCGDTVKRAT